MKSLRVIFLAPLFWGCATTYSIRTTPEKAQVYVKPYGASEYSLVGETPVVVTEDQLPGGLGHSGPFWFEVRKPGYQTESVLVTEVSKIRLELNYQLQTKTGLESHETLNVVVDGLFAAQRLAKVGRFDESLKTLQDLQIKAPNIAAIYEITGGVYLLQRKYSEAFDAYSLAVKYNPSNVESVRIRNTLGNSLGRQLDQAIPLPVNERAPAAAAAAQSPTTLPPKTEEKSDKAP